MHELEITKKIIEVIKRESKKHNLIPKKAFIEVGELTTYKKDPIKFYFEKISKLDCELDVKEIKGKVKCNKCGEETNVDPLLVICGKCGSGDVNIIDGNDIRIKGIEG